MEPDWAAIDPLIFEGRRVEAAAEIRRMSGRSLADALEVLGQRVGTLAETRPESFTVDIDTFWDGFHS